MPLGKRVGSGWMLPLASRVSAAQQSSSRIRLYPKGIMPVEFMASAICTRGRRSRIRHAVNG